MLSQHVLRRSPMRSCEASGRAHRVSVVPGILRRDVRVANRRASDPIIPPVILAGKPGQEEAVDLMNHLLQNRIIYIGSRIGDDLMALEALDAEEPIKMYINSNAGAPYAVFGILDTMALVKPPIATVGLGAVCQASVLLLAGGTKGMRYSMANTRIMLNQPMGGCQGSAQEVKIQATELNRTMQVVHAFLEKFTGLPLERIQEESDRENFMTPKEAVELGLIDGIVE